MSLWTVWIEGPSDRAQPQTLLDLIADRFAMYPDAVVVVSADPAWRAAFETKVAQTRGLLTREQRPVHQIKVQPDGKIVVTMPATRLLQAVCLTVCQLV